MGKMHYNANDVQTHLHGFGNVARNENLHSPISSMERGFSGPGHGSGAGGGTMFWRDQAE